MTAEEIIMLINTWTPVITAVIGMIATIIVAIKRCQNASDKTIKEVDEALSVMQDELKRVADENEKEKAAKLALMQENIELKKELRTTLKAIKRIGD